MLDIIHRMFEERLSSYCHDIFVRTAVLAVGVGPLFYGFSMGKQLFWPISWFCLAKQSFQMVADLDWNILKIL